MSSKNTAPLHVLPQVVPGQVCFTCSVCCRFPEIDSFLRPYFTEDEISRAVLAGVDRSQFPDTRGSQVNVVPNSIGEGFICPAFDPHTARCTIYPVRPLDCQIYPLALMWNASHTEVVIGWDSKCPFLGQDDMPPPLPLTPHPSREVLEGFAEQIAAVVEREDTLATIVKHPKLVGPFQEDVTVFRTLPVLTQRLAVASTAVSPPLTPVRLEDRQKIEVACASSETRLGAYGFAWHFIWNDLFAYSYTEIADHFCLFAEYGDGIYMPLPPLHLATEHATWVAGQSGSDSEETGFAQAVAICFELMRARNKGSAVSRVENVAEERRPVFEALGYRARPKDSDYLYRTSDLVALAGDRYKSQRAAVNRFRRTPGFRLEPYADRHFDGCVTLLNDWMEKKQTHGLDGPASQMLQDSGLAHRRALGSWRELGLRGSVVWVDGIIRGYTFGYDRSPHVFCVLLEVADRAIHGLAQFLFQQTCSEAQVRGMEYINALDDSGLPDLSKTKRAYHPVELVASYVVTER